MARQRRGIYDAGRGGRGGVPRFTQPDTIVPGGGAIPQALNRYSYVYNNPIRFSDPTGHQGGTCAQLQDAYGITTCTEARYEPILLPGVGGSGSTGDASGPDVRMPVGDLSPSDRAVDLVRDVEHPVATPYNDGCFPPNPGCTVGNCTVATGHLIHLGVCGPGDFADWGTLSTSEMEDLFQKDILKKGMSGIPGWITVPLTQYEYDALVLLSFNGGSGVLQLSPLLRTEINEGPQQWDESVIIAEWNWGSSQFDELPGLRPRRAAEVKLFVTGIYPDSMG